MGSKGRMPAPHLRRPPPGPGILHPEPFGPGMRPLRPPFSPFDMLPPPEIVEQKLGAQHVEMQKLAMENQRLADTHGTLRQELAAAQYELQVLHAQIGAMKSDGEQQMRSLMDKTAKMEADLKAAEPVKKELQQARAEAQSLAVRRQELIAKVQQLNQDLQRTHLEVQQLPVLVSELEGLRQEYHHCRASYDYEKKLYDNHLESVQVMEKNYMAMAREVEKLRAELSSTANVDRRTGGPYNAAPGSNENDASGLPVVQNSYEDSYAAAAQGRGPVPAAAGGSSAASNVSGVPAYGAAQTGPPPARTSYDATRLSNYNISRASGYDPSTVSTYDGQRAVGYEAYRGTAYDTQGVTGFVDAQRAAHDPQRGPGYDPQRGPYDGSRGPGYDPQLRGPAGIAAPQGHVAAVNNAPYGSATPPPRNTGAYEAPSRGGNPVRR